MHLTVYIAWAPGSDGQNCRKKASKDAEGLCNEQAQNNTYGEKCMPKQHILFENIYKNPLCAMHQKVSDISKNWQHVNYVL